ncbi:brachyurin [Drosophila tropicalis]|uniref:brachyurin n=1 Tax=Drosophila tropicalis TaxID=46794 RepID=UPI0035ABC8BA
MRNYKSLLLQWVWVLLILPSLNQAGYNDHEQQNHQLEEEEKELQLQHNYEQWRLQCEKYDTMETGITTRIAGGNLAEAEMFPYQVSLLIESAGTKGELLQCGGSLIAQDVVLTAAHCLWNAKRVRVFMGSLRFADPTDATETFLISQEDFTIYPGYLGFGGYNDLAVIHLPKKAKLSNRVQTIALLDNDYMQDQLFLVNQAVSVSGWGSLSDGANSTHFHQRNRLLYYADVRVMEQEKCECYYLPGLVSRSRHLCTDGSNAKGACQGDSGGPLVLQWQNINYLIGIISFGNADGCEVGSPTVYTRVSTFSNWLQHFIQK